MDIVSWVGVARVNTIINCTTSGGRGVTMQRYLDIGGNTLTSLFSATTFPDNPDNHSVNPSFQSEAFVRSDCLLIVILFSLCSFVSVVCSHDIAHEVFVCQCSL